MGGCAFSRPPQPARWRPPACPPPRVGCGVQLEPGWLPHGERRDASCSGSAGPGRVRAGCASQRVPPCSPALGKRGALATRCRGAEPEGE